jgi:hypothetical protein
MDAVTSIDELVIKKKADSKNAGVFYVSAKTGKGLDEAFE